MRHLYLMDLLQITEDYMSSVSARGYLVGGIPSTSLVWRSKDQSPQEHERAGVQENEAISKYNSECIHQISIYTLFTY